MLVAENHGKILLEAANHEDYMTSAVFGVLRFVEPKVFWQLFFERTKSSTADELPLTQMLHHPVSGYSRLETWFWLSHSKYGEPDLIFRFSGGTGPSLVVIVEVKLWSGKSGSDEQDQLARYLRLLDDLPTRVPTSVEDQRYLLYLTPRDSLAEIEQTLTTTPDHEQMRRRLYRIQWQDILEVARKAAIDCGEPAKTILEDVAEFLRRRKLEYFDGYHMDLLLEVGESEGRFYEKNNSTGGRFSGMSCIEWLEMLQIMPGGWTQ